MSKLLVLHGLFEARCFLPEETFPGGEVSAFEKSMLQYTLYTTECLDHIRAVIVQVPKFAIMLLMGPPEWVLLKDLILLEVLTNTPALVISER